MILFQILYRLLIFSVFYSLLLLVLLKIYNVFKKGWCKSKVCLKGKTVIVTGANTGIGYETSLEFAKRGAKVILACRDLKKAEEAREKIVAITQNDDVIVKELDLSSLKSVRDFAKNIKENEERLDILVNNAGCASLTPIANEDGLQSLMLSNYFSPVLLTILLINLLKKTDNSRIINVSSGLAQQSNLTVGNLNMWPGSKFLNYNNSKLAIILFTVKLSELLKGSRVTTYSLHPGAVDTDIWKNLRGKKNTLINIFKMLYFKNSEEGAQTILYTALEQGIEKYSGQHFEECQRISPYKRVQDPPFIDEIWNKTVELLHCGKEVAELFN